MPNKLRVLIIVGVLEVVALAILSGFKSNTISILGYQGFKLGNRTIILKAPPKMELITDSKEIKRRLHIDEEYSFALVTDTSAPRKSPVVGDYVLAGKEDDFPKLVAFLEKDTSVRIVRKNMTEDELTVVFSPRSARYDSSFHLFFRYTKCYPYYLRIASGWLGTEAIPTSVMEAMTGIEVRE